MEKLFARLIVTYKNNEKGMVTFLDKEKQICDTIDLAMVDYILSRFGSLERYKEEAIKMGWLTSGEVTLTIEDVQQNSYPLPFDTKYNDIIFKTSESAIVNGDGLYIIKGEGNQMVSDSEFHDFFNDFLACILSEEGYTLLQRGYFNAYPNFESLLHTYYKLNQKEDDMYADAQLHRIEKSYLSTPNTPNTLDDFLRNYPIFRSAVSFNLKCLEMRNENKVEETLEKPTVVLPNETPSLKRSLCYLIGNNCEPLILKTMDAYFLDDYIINHYNDAKEIKRENEAIIKSYILSHREYVQQIRNLIQNQQYSGQLTILEHNPDGSFKRLSSGSYLRLPILYTKTFKEVHNFSCSLGLFRKEAQQKKKRIESLDNQILSKKAQMAYGNLEAGLKEVIAKLEEEKRVTKEDLERVMHEIKQVVSDMQELERKDYNSAKNPTYNRLFSENIAKKIRFTKATRIKKEFINTLDEWARSIENSPNRYDNIRSILRHLRKKEPFSSYFAEAETKKEEGKPTEKEKPKVENPQEKESESFLSVEELKQMYGEDLPSLEELQKKNIYVQK